MSSHTPILLRPARRGAIWLCAGVALAALAAAWARPDDPPATQPTPPARDWVPAATDETSLVRGLLGSKHDFSEGGRLPRDLCTGCHTPHLPAPQFVRSITLRSTAAADRPERRALQDQDVQLSAASLMCLSCHNGTVAPDVFTGVHSMTWSDRSGVRPQRARLVSHPVGTRYPDGAPKYASTGAVTAAGLPLPDGRIQCTTCHDPHNTQRHPGMLVTSNERSRLCLACHRL